MQGRPDLGKESPDYAVGLTETLSYCTDEELAWLTNPRDGLSTVCKFLPTAADIHEFIRNKRAKLDEFKPAHTTYRRFGEERGPWDEETDYERKKRIVEQLLGYNPSPKAVQTEESRRVLVPPTPEEVRNLRLKTPPAPPSKYLFALLEAEGWPFIPKKEEAA